MGDDFDNDVKTFFGGLKQTTTVADNILVHGKTAEERDCRLQTFKKLPVSKKLPHFRSGWQKTTTEVSPGSSVQCKIYVVQEKTHAYVTQPLEKVLGKKVLFS